MKTISFFISVFWAVNGLAQIPTDGLVAYYPFTGNAKDYSGNGYDGIVNEANLIPDRFGNDLCAYSFTGINSNITSLCPGVLGNQARSVSLWMRIKSTSSGNLTGLSYGKNFGSIIQGSAFGCYLYFDGSLTVGIDVQDGAIRYAPISDDLNWHHYIWVVQNEPFFLLKDVLLYQDGHQLTTAVDWWNNKSYSENAVINTLAGSNLFIGMIGQCDLDDIRLYNRSLNPNEISALHNEEGNFPRAPVSNWPIIVVTFLMIWITLRYWKR